MNYQCVWYTHKLGRGGGVAHNKCNYLFLKCGMQMWGLFSFCSVCEFLHTPMIIMLVVVFFSNILIVHNRHRYDFFCAIICCIVHASGRIISAPVTASCSVYILMFACLLGLCNFVEFLKGISFQQYIHICKLLQVFHLFLFFFCLSLHHDKLGFFLNLHG